MEAEREYVRENGDKLQEFYWAGKTVVYVNNQLTDKTFDEVLDEWTV